MNKVLRAFLLSMALSMWVPSADAKDVLVHFDFEDQIPGEQPQGWRLNWGHIGDDLFMISNLRAAGGRQSMVLDKRGTNTAHWGFGTLLPQIKSGWLLVSFSFLIEGREADFSIEFQNGNTNAMRWQFANNIFSAGRHRYDPGKWYRVRVWLPGPDRPDATAWMQMERRTQEGGYEPVGKAVKVLCAVARNANPHWRINPSPGHRNYRVFFDEVSFERIEDFEPE